MRKSDPLSDIKILHKMSAAALQAIHREMFGVEHAIANCQHLRRKIAWHVQAAKEGGLPEAVRSYALFIARETDLRTRIAENAMRRKAAIPVELTATTSVVHNSGDSRLAGIRCSVMMLLRKEAPSSSTLRRPNAYERSSSSTWSSAP